MTPSSVNRLFAAGGLGLAAALFAGAAMFPDRALSAARYIFFLGGSLAALSLLLFFQNEPATDSPFRWIRSKKNFFRTLGALLVYCYIISLIGFFPASALFMGALAPMLGFRRPLFILLAIGLVLGFTYLIFVHSLGVPVPAGLWGE